MQSNRWWASADWRIICEMVNKVWGGLSLLMPIYLFSSVLWLCISGIYIYIIICIYIVYNVSGTVPVIWQPLLPLSRFQLDIATYRDLDRLINVHCWYSNFFFGCSGRTSIFHWYTWRVVRPPNLFRYKRLMRCLLDWSLFWTLTCMYLTRDLSSKDIFDSRV